MPQPTPSPENVMHHHIQEDFRNLRSEVSEFLSALPRHDPNRMIVDIWFDRVEQSVNEVDSEYEKKNHAAEVITEVFEANAKILPHFDKCAEEIKAQIAKVDSEGSVENAVMDLLTEIRENIETLTSAFVEAVEVVQ